jgi:hypothetical protein
MLGKLSIIGAVAAILMIPTALSAQMGGAVSPGVHVGGAVNPGATVRGAVERGIPGPDLGTWRSPSTDNRSHHKHKTTTKPRRWWRRLPRRRGLRTGPLLSRRKRR